MHSVAKRKHVTDDKRLQLLKKAVLIVQSKR